MKVLDKGEIVLLKYCANDLDVVAAARISNAVDYENASKGPEKDEALIRYLMKHRHTSPFEHTYFRWYVKVPFFVAREWHRHRVGWSYNEVSGRYVEFGKDFPMDLYLPTVARTPGSSTKQGSVDVPPNSDLHWLMALEIEEASLAALDSYRALIDSGVARELARMVLPLNMYTAFVASCNARSLMHFLSLRNAPDAQYEIRVYAQAMEEMFKEVMPMTHRAFVENGRMS
jgi:thymidylate synthase (FAD)